MIPVIGLAMIIGVTLGLFGGGGGILTVPLLHYGIAMPVDQAIATSLLIICITSIASTWQHAKQNHVLWREGYLLGFSGIIGAVLGAQLSALFPPQSLLLLLSSIMFASGIAMLCNRNDLKSCDVNMTKHSPMIIIFIGTIVGVVTGMVGAGGGFLVVPTLVILLNLPIPVAIGTSLFVISLNSASGFIAHYQTTTLDFKIIAIVSFLAVVGALIGGKIALKFSISTLRKSFSFFIILVAILLIAAELPIAIQQDWFQRHSVSWGLLMLAIIISLFYFLTRSCLSKIWRVPFFNLNK
tara:strand:+ start:675 stop:1565 length:891 start_codon:yes stop_codon:yes gene_type:complete